MDELLRAINELPNHFMFRGHSNSDWKLHSSLERMVGSSWNPEFSRKLEQRAQQNFQSKFHIYNNTEVSPETNLSWLAMMQHYGVPTRLLDFTVSPYIALYFALESYKPHEGNDLALYAINFKSVNTKTEDILRSRKKPLARKKNQLTENQDEVFDRVQKLGKGVLWITEPCLMNRRLDRQHGTFLIHDFKQTIEQAFLTEYKSCDARKFIIPKTLYKNVYALLRKIGIDAKSIYGDLNGLGCALRMEAQAYSS